MNEPFSEIQAAHDDLLLRYSQLVKEVGKPGTRKMILVFVEDHIRRILLELIKSYTALKVEFRSSPEKPTKSIEWLGQATEDCEALAKRLISFRDTLSTPFWIIKLLALVIGGYFLFSIYGEVTGLFEVLMNTGPLINYINQHKLFIVGGMNVLLPVVTLVFSGMVIDNYFRKRALFGDPEFKNQFWGVTSQENIYALENQLFSKIPKRKPRDFPVDLVSIVTFLVLVTILLGTLGRITDSNFVLLQLVMWIIGFILFSPIYWRRFTRGNL